MLGSVRLTTVLPPVLVLGKLCLIVKGVEIGRAPPAHAGNVYKACRNFSDIHTPYGFAGMGGFVEPLEGRRSPKPIVVSIQMILTKEAIDIYPQHMPANESAEPAFYRISPLK
ncbi:MAG: hypothetical protein EPN57_07505 [Paraburkholderia sp.]|nr:MAG: hypothetical protein EPN57_07505 [Paraburkholderia sp.]